MPLSARGAKAPRLQLEGRTRNIFAVGIHSSANREIRTVESGVMELSWRPLDNQEEPKNRLRETGWLLPK